MTDEPEPNPHRPREDDAFFHRGPAEAVADGVVFCPSFGTCTAFLCGDRLLLVDTATDRFAPNALEDFRANHFPGQPVEAVVYTHGHIDHVTGVSAWLAEAEERGHPRPRIIAHEAVTGRFDRYRLLGRQNDHINRVQFNLRPDERPFSGAAWVYPDETYARALVLTVGGERFELHHARGETDDATWVWCPDRRVVCTGDLFVWSCPNAGNPYKVQRYALDWAQALEEMAALRPRHLLPGHGPPLAGEERIQDALTSTAAYLRSIHDQVVAGMNEGKWLEDIVRDLEYPSLDKPWLRPIYDHPEFVARNVYRLYGGWYDGDPANLFPAHSRDIAREVVSVCGADALLARARALQQADEPDLRMACHLVDFVRKADPDNRQAWGLWRELFLARIGQEPSFMARGAYHSAVREAEARLAEM